MRPALGARPRSARFDRRACVVPVKPELDAFACRRHFKRCDFLNCLVGVARKRHCAARIFPLRARYFAHKKSAVFASEKQRGFAELRIDKKQHFGVRRFGGIEQPLGHIRFSQTPRFLREPDSRQERGYNRNKKRLHNGTHFPKARFLFKEIFAAADSRCLSAKTPPLGSEGGGAKL